MFNDKECDVSVYESELCKIESLSKMSFKNALCMFIPEVTKVEDGSDYPGRTLYEMIRSIQKYLHQNKVYSKLLDDPEFRKVQTVLDNVIKERVEANMGMIRKQAKFISLEHENKLWEKGILGKDTPDKLHITILLLLGIHCGLRASDKHCIL